MAIKVFVTKHFEKSFQRLPQRIKKLAVKKDNFFRKDIFSPSLKTHRLKGKLKEFYSYRINQEYRLVFKMSQKDIVIYHDIGTHQLYR
ncbi:MAG: type II toxin-antitoxin system mRNA interferase toxin, RelE/StbE family [Patescibacteria group bacterium]